MFSATLSTIAKTWKQSKYLLTEQWIKKMWYTYTMEHYSIVKKKRMQTLFAATWMDQKLSH